MIPAINVPAASVSNQALQFRDTCAGPRNEPRVFEDSQAEAEDEDEDDMGRLDMKHGMPRPILVEKTLIIHRDEHGFGLRLMGSRPAYVEHVHENGAAWRAGVRALDKICKVNGRPVGGLEHKDVVLMFKSCTRFVALTLFTPATSGPDELAPPPSLQTGAVLSGSSINKLLATNHQPHHHHQQQHNLHLHRPHSFERFHSNNSSGPAAIMTSLLLSSGSSLRRGHGSGCGGQQQHQARRSESVSAAARPHYLTSNNVNISTTLIENRPTSAMRHQQLCVDREKANDECRSQFAYLAQPSLRQRAYGSLRGDLNSGSLNQHHNHGNKPQVEIKVFGSRDDADTKLHTQEQLKISQSANDLANMQQQQQPKQPINKRLEIIKEFIDTENTHTDRLRLLDELFYRPLKEGSLMSAEQLRSVFSCHRTLYKIHRQIYRTLMSASYNMCAEPMIGAALLEIFEGDLKRRLERAACLFCAAQSTNSELLNKLTRRDTKVGEFIARVTSQQMVGRLGIKDLLASCFQRLTKYPLLLENLLKATPQSPPAKLDEPEVEEDKLDEAERNSRRMLAIGLAEEREFIGRALHQSRQILIKVNESVKVATSSKKLKEIWKRTDKYPGVPLVDISNQQVLHEGQLTLRLSKRSFDVYVLLLTDYLIILTREGQDKYRLKFFTPDGKYSSSSSSSNSGNPHSVYSPVFVIDEHLSTRDAATDENGFYLLCKRKDDSRIYEFASRSPADRSRWRERIQSSIEHQMSRSTNRRPSCESTTTKSSSEISTALVSNNSVKDTVDEAEETSPNQALTNKDKSNLKSGKDNQEEEEEKIEGTISYVEDDGIVMPNKMESSCAQVDQAVQVTLTDAK